MINLLQRFEQQTLAESGQKLHQFAAQLYPICRSITGDGLRRTLAMIADRIPLKISEVATGTAVFDWAVPKEWNIRDAYIKDSAGRRVVDFRENNLHVLNYSTPIHTTLPLSKLKEHLFTLPEHPDNGAAEKSAAAGNKRRHLRSPPADCSSPS